MNQQIDQQALDQFMAPAAEFTAAERALVAQRLENMIARKERAKLGSSFVNLATMQAAVDALRAMGVK